MEQDLYEFSTELDADEHGCGGLAQLIRVNPPDSPNPRSILHRKRQRCRKELQK